MKKTEKELEKFARYIWGLSPHNFYDRNYRGNAKDQPLDKYKVLEVIRVYAKRIKKL